MCGETRPSQCVSASTVLRPRPRVIFLTRVFYSTSFHASTYRSISDIRESQLRTLRVRQSRRTPKPPSIARTLRLWRITVRWPCRPCVVPNWDYFGLINFIISLGYVDLLITGVRFISLRPMLASSVSHNCTLHKITRFYWTHVEGIIISSIESHHSVD